MYGEDRDRSAAIVKLQNEKLAELLRPKAEQFAAFASLALQLPDLAAQQLETTIRKQVCEVRPVRQCTGHHGQL